MNRYIVSIVILLVVAGFASPMDASAKANKVKLVDACENISTRFCDASGESTVPDFISGFAIFNPTQDGTAMLTVLLKGSRADTVHTVYMCPGGGITASSGYTGCAMLGNFTTNINGHGSFHYEWDVALGDTIPTDKAVVVNIQNDLPASKIANCGDSTVDGTLGSTPCNETNSIQP